MFKIGDFSRISLVTVKTLRFYDEIGLLKPARVDDFTGYRYYTADQLPRLNRILALKDLGFTLEQIAPALDEGVSPDRLRGMLCRKRAEIQRRMQEEQKALGRVEARLKQIEQEGKMSSYEVVIKKVEPIRVASVREVLPIYPDIGRLFCDLFGYIAQQGARPAGPCSAIWHETEYKERDVDAEACVPVDADLPGSGRIRVYELPAVETMASTIHHGAYNRFCEAYTAILKWIEANGYTIVGPNREIYLQSGGDGAQDDESCVSEIQFPVARV
jgi:effector-binding domain-containing protein